MKLHYSIVSIWTTLFVLFILLLKSIPIILKNHQLPHLIHKPPISKPQLNELLYKQLEFVCTNENSLNFSEICAKFLRNEYATSFGFLQALTDIPRSRMSALIFLIDYVQSQIHPKCKLKIPNEHLKKIIQMMHVPRILFSNIPFIEFIMDIGIYDTKMLSIWLTKTNANDEEQTITLTWQQLCLFSSKKQVSMNKGDIYEEEKVSLFFNSFLENTYSIESIVMKPVGLQLFQKWTKYFADEGKFLWREMQKYMDRILSYNIS